MGGTRQSEVAKNCPASWRDMTGDDRVRHCSRCDRNVYNISNMTREDAAALIQASEGRLCVRYYLRSDGGIMTRDCGRPQRAAFRLRLLLAGLLAALGIGGCTVVQGDACDWKGMLAERQSTLRELDAKLKKTKDWGKRVDLKKERRQLLLQIEEYKRYVAQGG